MNVDWPLMVNAIRRGLRNHTFGMVRKYADGRPKPHQGWDFASLVGTPTFAVADGKVEFVELNRGDYGTQICTSFQFNGMKLFAFYAHLQHVHVWPGQPIRLGELIATTGESGNAKSMPQIDQHLHFEIRLKATAGRGLIDRLDPIEVFKTCPLQGFEWKAQKSCPAPIRAR